MVFCQWFKNFPMKTLKSFLSPFLFLFLVGSGLSVSAQTVYITKTGEKYHEDGCRYLSKSAYSISLSDAKEKGYTACKVCKPTAKVSTTPKAGTNKAQKPTYKATPKANQSATSKQCSALTQSKKRCSRMTKDTSGKCWQHQ
jgi:hypothetical protein